MSQNYKWLIGCVVSMSLLGACAAPGDESSVQPNGAAPVESAQELRGSGQELGEVTVSLSVDQTSFAAAEDVAVTVIIGNGTRHPVSLLKWYTPAEDVEEELFQVTRDGQPVEFTGPHYKRPAPRTGDFLRLAPGESLIRTVDLSDFYDLSQSGNHTLRFVVSARDLYGPGAGRSGVIESNSVTVWVEGRPSAAPPGSDEVSGESTVSFTNCTTTQQATVIDAVAASSAMADNSLSYLNGTTPGPTPRYTTWFGTYSLNGWNTAKTHFVAIKDALDSKPLTFDCKCKKNYYAYVYPNQPYTVYLCNVFWTAPMTGTDSKGGTIIHELSHFNVVAGTNDWAYGQSACKNLALSDPNKALNNADSHEYFAENTPFLN